MTRRQRRAMKRCPEKLSYPTIVGAREHAERLKDDGVEGADRLRPYLCRLCFRFHVGHARKRRP